MDRNLSGIIAGVSGGILMNIWSLLSYHVLNFADLRFLDWSSILIFGQKTEGFSFIFVSLIAQLLWSGFLGAIFAHVIPIISWEGYLIKGAFYGGIVSFLTYLTPALFQHPHLTNMSLGTAITDITGGILWGVTTILILRYIADKYELKN